MRSNAMRQPHHLKEETLYLSEKMRDEKSGNPYPEYGNEKSGEPLPKVRD